MTNFFNQRPPLMAFGNMAQQLNLHPENAAQFREIEAELASRRILPELLRPNWPSLLPGFQAILSAPRPNIFSTPAPAAGAQPNQNEQNAEPRAGELADVARAFYQLPFMQGLLTRAYDEAVRQVGQMRRAGETGPAANARVTTVTMATVFAGVLLVPVLANQPTRSLAFALMTGIDIPVPGVDGLSFQYRERGGSVTAPVFLPVPSRRAGFSRVPGLSVTGAAQFPEDSEISYEVTLTLDVSEFISGIRRFGR